MKVISQQNPIIINKVRINNDSNYLSAEGITVVLNSAGKTKAFQDWMDANHSGWVSGKNLNKGSGYGNNGPSTTKAWGLYGDSFLIDAKNMMGFGVQPTTQTNTQTNQETPPTLPPNVSVTDPKGNKKAGMVWDKAKGVWAKADEFGIVDKFFDMFGIHRPGKTQQDTNTFGNVGNTSTQEQPKPDEKKPMSKGLKIGLIVGGVVLLGTIIYFATRKKATK